MRKVLKYSETCTSIAKFNLLKSGNLISLKIKFVAGHQ